MNLMTHLPLNKLLLFGLKSMRCLHQYKKLTIRVFFSGKYKKKWWTLLHTSSKVNYVCIDRYPWRSWIHKENLTLTPFSLIKIRRNDEPMTHLPVGKLRSLRLISMRGLHSYKRHKKIRRNNEHVKMWTYIPWWLIIWILNFFWWFLRIYILGFKFLRTYIFIFCFISFWFLRIWTLNLRFLRICITVFWVLRICIISFKFLRICIFSITALYIFNITILCIWNLSIKILCICLRKAICSNIITKKLLSWFFNNYKSKN